MFRLFQRARERHLVDEGRVCCPARGHDVDFDLCAGCRQLIEIQLATTPPYVRCAAQSASSPLLQ
ncbi:MAG TPA: hypothetical protein VIV54_12440 [Burkholderiales bacterium]